MACAVVIDASAKTHASRMKPSVEPEVECEPVRALTPTAACTGVTKSRAALTNSATPASGSACVP
jgi:hypothetical protein